MSTSVVHPDCELFAEGPLEHATIVSIADRIQQLADQADQLTTDLAALLRDGHATDAAPVQSAKELLGAATALQHAATVATVLGYAQGELTQIANDDAIATVGRWCERHTGTTRSECTNLARAGRCIARYPRIATAYLNGRIRLGHLVSIDRIIPARYRGQQLDNAVAAVRSVEIELVTAAEAAFSDRDFAKFCTRVRDRLDPDGTPDTSREPSTITLQEFINGRWAIRGDLSADDGSLLAAFLADADHRHRTHQRNLAPADRAPLDPLPERNATHLIGLCRDGAAAKRPGRIALYLHIDLDDLRTDPLNLHDHSGDTGHGRGAHTETGHDLTDESLWDLLADADVTPVFHRNGLPLHYGRTRRLAPHILKRVLAHRDRTCRFPGCDTPAVRSHAHHIIYWDNNGTTDPDNTELNCPYHHHLEHNTTWTTRDGPTGRTATRPDGQPHNPTPRWHRPRDNPLRQHILQRLHTNTTPNATPDTSRARRTADPASMSS